MCSQPTMSRLGNLAGPIALMRIMAAMVDLFCDSFVVVPSRIVLYIGRRSRRGCCGPPCHRRDPVLTDGAKVSN